MLLAYDGQRHQRVTIYHILGLLHCLQAHYWSMPGIMLCEHASFQRFCTSKPILALSKANQVVGVGVWLA